MRVAGAGAIPRSSPVFALCRAASARAMAGFHHNPLHDDDKLDLMQAEVHAALPGSFMAREGQVLRFSPKRAMAVA